jgi:hypothetical protein
LVSDAVSVLAGLPGFAALAAVAAPLTAVARLAAALAGTAGAGIRVGGVASGGGCAVGAAAVYGCGAGAAVGGSAPGSAVLGVSRVSGLAVGVVGVGAATVVGLAFGAATRSAAGGGAAPALPVGAGGAKLGGVAFSLGLEGVVGAGDGACAPNPVSTERKSAGSGVAAESDVSEFARAELAFEFAAPFALAVAAGAAESAARDAAPATFLSAMCGSIGQGTALRALIRLALLGQITQALLFVFPATDEPSYGFGALRGVLPAHALGVAFTARAHDDRILLAYRLR